MKMNTVPLFFKIFIIGGIVAIMIVCIPWIALKLGLVFSKEPAKPAETHGEFPYKLVYEINGKQYVSEGKFICEYGGISLNEGRGKHRTWKGFVNGTNVSGVLLFEDETNIIYCYIGDAGYYMGDNEYSGHNPNKPLVPHLYCKSKTMDEGLLISESEILDLYNINIIEYEFAKPIKNSFQK